MLEELIKEYGKFFDNETYQNYEIYKSQNYCLSRRIGRSGTLDNNILSEENKEHELEDG